jgi:hypothetical protein
MNATSLLTGFALVLIAVITIDWARSLRRNAAATRAQTRRASSRPSGSRRSDPRR